MNRKLIYTGLAAIVALASCQSSLDGGNAAGSLSISVNTGATKAAMSADEILANADVRIYKDDFPEWCVITNILRCRNRCFFLSEAIEWMLLPAKLQKKHLR